MEASLNSDREEHYINLEMKERKPSMAKTTRQPRYDELNFMQMFVWHVN